MDTIYGVTLSIMWNISENETNSQVVKKGIYYMSMHLDLTCFQIATTIWTQDLDVNHTPTNHTTITQWNIFIRITIFHRIVNVLLWTGKLSEFLLVGYASFEQKKIRNFRKEKLFYRHTDCFRYTNFLIHFPVTYSVLWFFPCDIHE